MGKVYSHKTQKVWEKTSKSTGSLQISGEAEINTVPKIWEM